MYRKKKLINYLSSWRKFSMLLSKSSWEVSEPISITFLPSAFESLTHLATRRRGDVVTTSLCTFQRRRRYVSNETPNDVSVERRQEVSAVCLHDVLLVCCNDISTRCNDDVPSIRLYNVSNRFQMKHPTMSQWYVTKTSQWYISLTFH